MLVAMETKPARSGSNRFIRGRRQEAQAEIEGWIAETRAETVKAGASRVSSQPSKNITEQKMLDSKLYDMSKQRLNFILQCQWQRKLFLEKQKRKTAVMHDLLRNVDVTTFSDSLNGKVQRQSDMRRATVNPGDRRQKIVLRQPKAATTIPGPRDQTQTEPSPFVTQQKDAYLAALARSDTSVASDDARAQNATSEDPDVNKTSPARVWPMCDARYVRLSESLCDNYPKESVAVTTTTNKLSPAYKVF